MKSPNKLSERNDNVKRIDRSEKVRVHFHQAKWDEPIIYELSTPGERGILVGAPDEEIAGQTKGIDALPEGMKRNTKLNLPELSQSRVLRHYARLAQQTLGADVNIEIGQGTCTVKYSPKVNEQLSALIREYHPLQDADTVQGMLEIFHETDKYMSEISGMDHFTFQPGGGSQGILTMASVMRAYFKDKGEDRDEIITTIYSHPSDAAAPAVAGFKIVYLQPDEKTGVPDLEQLKAAAGPKTAGYIVANPEDTGVYNSHVKEFVDYIHSIGGLCGYDRQMQTGCWASQGQETQALICASSISTKHSPRPTAAAVRPAEQRECRRIWFNTFRLRLWTMTVRNISLIMTSAVIRAQWVK